MTRPSLTTGLLVALIAVGSAGGGYWLARHQPASTPAMPAAPATVAGKQPLYWYDPMVPDQHFDKPGKSPFMDMELVPKYADGDTAGATSGLRVDSSMQQNLGLRLATVERGSLSSALTVPALVGFDERAVAIVQTRAGGFVERTYDRAPGDVVTAGTPLLDLLVPDWAGAQAEFLALRQTGDAALTQAARQRLQLLGMPDTLIRQVELNGQVRNTVTVTAPIGGVIQSLDIRQGMTVSPGMTVARLNGLATVWLEAAIPEAQAPRVQPGLAATATLTADPGQPLTGKVIAILPAADPASRTLRVRLAFPNPHGKLRPGLFAQVRLASPAAPDALLIPSEALIRTGTRTVVIVIDTQGHFQPVTVTPGAEADGKTAILSGLQAGDRVVVSGQFLIDSEASLQGVLTRLPPAPAAVPVRSPSPAGIPSQGVIEAFGPGEITLSHAPIPELQWPAMTMAFPLAAGIHSDGFKVGQTVRFTLVKRGEELVVASLQPAGGRP